VSVGRLVIWSLADTMTSVDELRAEPAERTPGATQEIWFSDETTDRWGGFAVFADAEAAEAPLPDRLRELLGKDPDVFELFDVAP
jgi:hypothetical protein